MSFKITRAGLLDTIQDLGRYGYQHLGINPGGVMDRFSAQLANALLGKKLSAPVIEMHFPASQILFQQPCVLCISGGDFTPLMNAKEVSMHQPIAVKANTVLSFKRRKKGARCYVAFLDGLHLTPWLNSYSTHLKAGAGGFEGRRLLVGDEIGFEASALSLPEDFVALPWQYHVPESLSTEMEFITGQEWDWLSVKSQTYLLNNILTITAASDRMGYRLQGKALVQEKKEQLVSAAVSFGTLQLLPSGQLIVLMADHPTTGGYPRIGHVISAGLPGLAQMNPGEELKLVMTDWKAAEEKLIKQQSYLHRLQNTCNLKMQKWIDAHRH